MTRRVRVAVVVGLTTLALLTTLAVLQPVAVCHGWLTIPLRHPMSDLHGGAIWQQLPRCHMPPDPLRPFEAVLWLGVAGLLLAVVVGVAGHMRRRT